MYSWYWLIQLYRSDKYNGKFARTGISTLNGHICGHGHGGHGHGGHGHDGHGHFGRGHGGRGHGVV